jgi:mevalonate kinase
MLFGEYAVLDGHRAIAMCLDRRISCVVERGGGRLRVHSAGVFEPPVDLPASELSSELCPDPRLRLLWPLLRRHGDPTGLSLHFEAEFPPTWGLGSSSASTLAAAAALAGPGPERFGEVLAAQRQLQGSASGYDIATQLLGGFVLYRGGAAPKMERLDVPELDWLLAWTGTKASTGSMIGKVRERFALGHPLYDHIGALAETAAELLCGGHRRALGEAMNQGHALLAQLGAVPDDLASTVQRLQADSSIFGARMTGAGGGDSILLLVSDRDAASTALRSCGLEVLDLRPESEGLRMESAA